jgi:hypothetical protein
MIELIHTSWGWTGIQPVEIVETNPFGNVIVRDKGGAYWRVCPEELQCSVVAGDDIEFEQLMADPEFRLDWEMAKLVDVARRRLGPLFEGRCYCLKTPGVLGGAYAIDNIGTIEVVELLQFAGDVGSQIKDVGDGETVRLEVEP